MSDLEAIRALANRFFDAIAAGDTETIQSVYAPNVVIWHNTDKIEQTREDNLRTLKGVIGFLPKRSYDERRLDVFPGGFVQQHVLNGVRQDGKKVAIEACLVCRVENGKITRLDEYLDSAAVTALTA
jgi:ketosteroid isomerase-like protein